jgi:hypothetical protein
MGSLAWLFPILLVAHISLAIALLLPSVVLPFTLRLRGGRMSTEPGRATRGLQWLQRNGSTVIGAGLALTGLGLVLVLGPQLLGQPWLLLALGLYATSLLVAFFIQRPGVASLLRIQPDSSEESRKRWREWARRQRYVSYVMAGLIGLIGFLMMTKPQL